jgi:prolyl-tRNA synthetase
VEIIPLLNEGVITRLSESLENQFEEKGIDSLVDDRNLSAGKKFRDGDLIGIPYKIIIGKKYLETGEVEVENRTTKNKRNMKPEEAINQYEIA